MKTLVTDTLGQHLPPLLPPPTPRRFRFLGRKPLDYRKVLTGIWFVLKTSIAWDDLPAKRGCGCGKTCRHYLRQGYQAGVWQQLHAVLLAKRNGADPIDWHGSHLGVFRWFVERTIAWLHQFGRLRRRLDRLTEIHNAFLQLGCSLICLRFLYP